MSCQQGSPQLNKSWKNMVTWLKLGYSFTRVIVRLSYSKGFLIKVVLGVCVIGFGVEAYLRLT
jgi:hypothetical protein